MVSGENDQSGFSANLSLLAHQHAPDLISTPSTWVDNSKEGARVECTNMHKEHIWHLLSSQHLHLSFLLQQHQRTSSSFSTQSVFPPTACHLVHSAHTVPMRFALEVLQGLPPPPTLTSAFSALSTGTGNMEPQCMSREGKGRQVGPPDSAVLNLLAGPHIAP